ncbi:MAG: acyltransferase [Prevotellaceae bacterium]|nr:acyltransferase [Prevotellaceae bacterium]
MNNLIQTTFFRGMIDEKHEQTSIPPSKPHYEILDGLRGVAAIMILIYHILETHTIFTDKNLIIGHGYLAVDFFFVLSGFVIGYAYDDRWGKMNFKTFIKRRFVRLHPMVVFGMILGAILFYFGASGAFPLIAETPIWKMLFYLLLGILLIPTPPSTDIRGWGEMHTLDAPVWSLFFEYIANILYALFIRKFSKIALAVLVFLSACATIYLSVFVRGDVSGGWSFNVEHLSIGFTRLFYPFFAGLLLYRLGKLTHVKNAFLWCSLLLIAVFVVPHIGAKEHSWMNGLYEAAMIIFVFPFIVYLGASGTVKGKYAPKLCKFLGDISYPVYLVNYPLIYVYTGWIKDTGYTFAQALPQALAVFVGAIVISYDALKLYDEPVRKWLKRF